MSLAGSQAGKNTDDNSEWSEPSRPAKRTRVAVACQRCKSRKQKCDGGQPTCGNCKNVPTTCDYIVPTKTIPHGTYQYIKALEARVVQLENTVTAAGLPDSGKDAWDSVLQSDSLPDQAGLGASGSTSKLHEDARSMEATQYLKDLSLHSGGDLVGDESLHIPVGPLFRSVVQTNLAATGEEYPQFDPTTYESEAPPDPLADISQDVAEAMLHGYLKYISTRWVILYRPHVMRLHNKNRRVRLVDPFEISTLNLIYAMGGRILETVGERRSFNPGKYHQAALQHFDLVLRTHDIRSVQTLLLHAVYCLRAPCGLSAWTYVGLATRLCISLGLHRRIPSERATLAIEVKKRVFWTCYSLDRHISIMLGRPFSISDRDIDAELPFDFSDGLSDAAIQTMPNPNPSEHASPSTSLSCFVHTLRLRRIESEIHQTLYRVDKYKPLSRSRIDGFLTSLAAWRQQAPPDFSESDTETYSYDGAYYYDVWYYQCLRILLYPHLTRPGPETDLVIKCADACGGICRTVNAIQGIVSAPFTLVAIYSVFLSGIILLYCLWLSPSNIYNMITLNDLHACSQVLVDIAERWPSAKRYSDAFETIRKDVMSLLDEGNAAGGVPIPGLDDHGGLREFASRSLHPEGRRLYSQIMRDMSGGIHPQEVPSSNPVPHVIPPSAVPQHMQTFIWPEPQMQQQHNPFYASDYDPSLIYGNHPGIVNFERANGDINANPFNFFMAGSGAISADEIRGGQFPGPVMSFSVPFDLDAYMQFGGAGLDHGQSKDRDQGQSQSQNQGGRQN